MRKTNIIPLVLLSIAAAFFVYELVDSILWIVWCIERYDIYAELGHSEWVEEAVPWWIAEAIKALISAFITVIALCNEIGKIRKTADFAPAPFKRCFVTRIATLIVLTIFGGMSALEAIYIIAQKFQNRTGAIVDISEIIEGALMCAVCVYCIISLFRREKDTIEESGK